MSGINMAIAALKIIAPKAARQIHLKMSAAERIRSNRAFAFGVISFEFIILKRVVWLNGQFLFLLNLPALVHDPGDVSDQAAREYWN